METIGHFRRKVNKKAETTFSDHYQCAPSLIVNLQGKAVGRMRGVGDLGDVRFSELGVVGNFHSPFPLLLPGVRDYPVIVGGQRFTVRKLHGAD